MKLEMLCRDLGFSSEVMEKIRPHWQEEEVPENPPEFFAPAFFGRYSAGLGLSAEEAAEVGRLVCKVHAAAVKSPALSAYGNWFFRQLYFEPGIFTVCGELPEPEALLGEASGIFALLISLGSIPLVERKYAELGLPEHCAQGPVKWIGGTVRLYQAAHGNRFGQCLGQTYWLRHSVNGELFRIGRFEYMIHETPFRGLPLFRHISNGETVLFADPAWLIGGDGFCVSPGTSGAWRAEFSDAGGKICGHPVDPATGRVRRESRELDGGVFKPVIAAHEWVIDLHIPGGGGMTPELVIASFREAVEFFRTYFKREVAAFVCDSWIFNPDWQEFLPESNLAKFQREVYLYPSTWIDPESGMFFVFGRTGGTRAEYPADNTLRRAFHRIWDSGRDLRSGGMLFLTADLDRFGEQLYRKKY